MALSAPLAELARDLDGAAHQLRQPLGDGQTKPGAAIFAGGRYIRLLECLEQAPDLLLRQADTGIADREQNKLAILAVLKDCLLYTSPSPRDRS